MKLINLLIHYWQLKAAEESATEFSTYPCIGQESPSTACQISSGSTSVVHSSLLVNSRARVQLDLHYMYPNIPQFNFCGFRESVLYFLYYMRAKSHFWSPGSAVPCFSSGQMLLGTPTIVCCYIFMHRCWWLKQPYGLLQKEMCQTREASKCLRET